MIRKGKHWNESFGAIFVGEGSKKEKVGRRRR